MPPQPVVSGAGAGHSGSLEIVEFDAPSTYSLSGHGPNISSQEFDSLSKSENKFDSGVVVSSPAVVISFMMLKPVSLSAETVVITSSVEYSKSSSYLSVVGLSSTESDRGPLRSVVAGLEDVTWDGVTNESLGDMAAGGSVDAMRSESGVTMSGRGNDLFWLSDGSSKPSHLMQSKNKRATNLNTIFTVYLLDGKARPPISSYVLLKFSQFTYMHLIYIKCLVWLPAVLS